MRMFGCVVMLCASCTLVQAEIADAIYSGGAILTVNDAQPRVEALAVRGSRIIAVGSIETVMATKGDRTRLVDLAGKTMIPGFIDSHSHIAQYEMTWGMPVLNPPPVGDVRSIEDIVRAMRTYVERKGIPAGELVLGNGYDDSLLAEGRHPTRQDLDRVSTNHPVLAVHASGHLIAANSVALRHVGYDRTTPNPEGGLIRRDTNGDPDGVCEELAGLPFLRLMKPNPMEQQLKNLVEIQKLYARYGITTAQDGISLGQNIALLREAAKRNLLFIDVVSYPRWDLFNDVLSGERTLDIDYHPPMLGCCGLRQPQGRSDEGSPRLDAPAKTVVGLYHNRLKIAGIKITADGSPQGKTAFLTRPYVRPPPGQPETYRGYSTVTQDELDRWFDLAYEKKVQLIVHCNGDAAADMMIASTRKAIERRGAQDLRPVMIHAQMIRHDQVDAMKELGIVPSFFTAHTFYWGDWHMRETVGRDRAYGMSPAAYAAKRGIRFTNHSDAPIVPPDPLMVMWTAVNRLSRSGETIGPDERITPLEALKASTRYAAEQYFEEGQKGTLEVGKLADLAILDRNPLEVDPVTIKDIQVIETIKEGQTVFP